MPIAISWQGATLGANTFTGAQVAPSLALGGAALSGNALAVTGAVNLGGQVTVPAGSSGTPSILFGGSSLTGLYQSDGYTISAAQTFRAGSLGLGNGANGTWNPANLVLRSDAVFSFAPSANATLSPDTALSRIGAGIIGVGTGAVGNIAGSVKLTDLFTNNAAAVIRTNTTLTNGAGVGVGTLTTAPSAGNPTKWIGIDDNGTTRYIPAW